MRFRKTIIAIAAAASLAAGGAAVGAPEAHAVTLYGLCDWNAGYHWCSRQTSGTFKYWQRDISGDSNQQIGRSYQGQVSNSGCWPFTCGGGNNSNFDGAAVYKMFNINSGLCLAASSLSSLIVYASSCSANGTNWVWDGSVDNSHLINVYQTNGHGNRLYKLFPFANNYDLMTQTGNESWGMVPVAG